jgi:hypothetical protein
MPFSEKPVLTWSKFFDVVWAKEPAPPNINIHSNNALHKTLTIEPPLPPLRRLVIGIPLARYPRRSTYSVFKFFPVFHCVTLLAAATELTFMHIVCLVARDTCVAHRRDIFALRGRLLMATLATHPAMTAF